MKCVHGINGAHQWQCHRPVEFVYHPSWSKRPIYACREHRSYDPFTQLPCDRPIEPARGMRRTALRDMARARNYACERRSRSDCSQPCPWYGPKRRISRLRKQEHAQ